MSTLTIRLRGLAATLALLLFVAGTPILLIAIHALPTSAAFTWTRLSAPDDGTLALTVIALVAWVGWAIFTFTVATAIATHLRGHRMPRVPVLWVPQLAADRLVATAILLFVAVPAASTVLPQQHAYAATTSTSTKTSPTVSSPATSATPQPRTSPTTAPTAVPRDSKSPARNTESYTVRRGDSLWKIAEERLGDGTRYVELVDLNHAVLDGRPDFLTPGTVLRVPTEPATGQDAQDGAYVVRPGDTLSQIAEDELGDATAYPRIAQASRDTVQPNGTHLTDPDVILPGWQLTIPNRSNGTHRGQPSQPNPTPMPTRGQTTAPAEPSPSPMHTPERSNPSDGPTPNEDHSAPDDPAADHAATDHTGTSDDGGVTPGWLLPGLAGSGGVLGTGLWLTLRARRRTQLRYRRPGTIISPPPPELIPAEKTALATASALATNVEALDAALRSFTPTPSLTTATLSSTSITLDLAEAVPPCAPWTGTGSRWEIKLADVPAKPADSFPPYPLLVSVGQNHDGSFVFLNLEELRTLTIDGDPDRTAGFARHLAAELAVNPWASVTRVDVLGLGADLASFNLGRIHTHPAGDTAFLNDLAHELSSITGEVEPDDYRAAIIATTLDTDTDAGLDNLAAVIESVPGRSSAALVNVVDQSGTRLPSATRLHISADGRLRADVLGLDLAAASLTPHEARACALLLDLTGEERLVTVPPPTDDTTVANTAGALVDKLTEPRPDGPAGDASLLPLPSHVYAEHAATLEEDLETIAPLARPAAEAAVQAADPGLDEDLARWESPVPVAAKLTLLGPVSARTMGDAQATAHRRPYYLELLAYLTLHPAGATAEQIAEALNIRPQKARSDLSVLRRWLGHNKAGDPYLPRAQQSHHDGEPATYAIHGVLCDLDLFRRLRARGQSRGAAGMSDLIEALRLVTGEPFTGLRKDGWTWLLEGDRIDHIMTAAIVDVAHIVTTHALTVGDLNLADFSSGIAVAACPYDEVATLDRAEVEGAAGDIESAEDRLRRDVFNRSDDDLGPIELPRRTTRLSTHTAAERRQQTG